MQTWQMAVGFLTAVVALVGVIFAPSALKAQIARYRWWFLGLGLLMLAWLFLIVLRRRMPSDAFPTSALPDEFRPGYWGWMYLFLAGGIVAAAGVYEQFRAARRGASAGPESPFPAIDAAWEEILV